MHIFSPTPDQHSGIMQPMNPVTPNILPNDFFDPVVNMNGIPALSGGPMDALSVISFADAILQG
jgi:hypothetical protein